MHSILLLADSNSDTDDDKDDDDIEVWKCVQEDCNASIKVNTKTLLMVEALGQHSCIKSLKMNVDEYHAILDGYIFSKGPGILSKIRLPLIFF